MASVSINLTHMPHSMCFVSLLRYWQRDLRLFQHDAADRHRQYVSMHRSSDCIRWSKVRHTPRGLLLSVREGHRRLQPKQRLGCTVNARLSQWQPQLAIFQPSWCRHGLAVWELLQVPLRDAYSVQLVSGYFAEFVKSGQPNPPADHLRARWYTRTLQGVRESGPWNEVVSASRPIKHLNYLASTGTFVDLPQCAWLICSIGYYLE